MVSKVKSITAFGTRGSVKGTLFSAKTDSQGRFVLNKKAPSPINGNTTNKAENKVYVSTLCEAANLLETDKYLINLVTADGSRALREFKKVKIERV